MAKNMTNKTTLNARLIEHCRGLQGATEDVKWEKDLVFSVGSKMFACFDLEGQVSLSFKVDSDLFQSLTQQTAFHPAPYLAKHSWVIVREPDSVPEEMLQDLLSDSHQLVGAKLSKKLQRSLGLLPEA